ncbi:hypothetical protein EB796_021705 [Bugula neritina]|uniref:Uncharacterized protein n=1 Tax=Bugula neritina TaxID=10212 RepID=A0A7J7J1I1_BUGNE|nr:hypothetical protein EB796_021705 [Bugula neritina]
MTSTESTSHMTKSRMSSSNRVTTDSEEELLTKILLSMTQSTSASGAPQRMRVTTPISGTASLVLLPRPSRPTEI